MAANRYEVIPGAALPLHLTVTDVDGAVVDLSGATVEATLTAGGGFSEAIAPSPVDSTTGWSSSERPRPSPSPGSRRACARG